MKIEKERISPETGEIRTLYITIGEDTYVLEEDRFGGMRITKSNLHSSAMEIHPCISNQIIIK